MLDTILQTIAPHRCYGCGVTGQPLCSNCKYNIIDEVYSRCIVCAQPASQRGICRSCYTHFDQAWCVGEREGVLKDLINHFKFDRVYAIGKTLGELLDEVVPTLPSETVVVPLPTVANHIRQLGYDHTGVIAREFAKKRGLKLHKLLKRRTNSIQHGANRSTRLKQANEAFELAKHTHSNQSIIVIDDIATTVSSLNSATKLLKDAGFGPVMVAVIAKQPIDQRGEI